MFKIDHNIIHYKQIKSSGSWITTNSTTMEKTKRNIMSTFYSHFSLKV